MSDQIVNVGSVLGKEIFNLNDGTFVGKVQGVFIDDAEKKIAGIQVKQKGLLGGKNVIPFANIKSFGTHTVTVSNLDGVMVAQAGKNILNMPVVTVDGTILGKIVDFAFEPENGQIVEYALKGGLMENIFDDCGIVAAEAITAIGKDVVIAKENLGESDFTKPEEELYDDWEVIDEVIEGLDEEVTVDADGEQKDASYEEQFDEITNKITKTFGEVTDKIKKEVTSDEFGDKLKEQADKIGEEAKGFLNVMKDKLQQAKMPNLDPDSLKQDLRNKMGTKATKKEDNEEVLASQIVEQLKNASVEKPLLDAEGNVIVWPGQLIGNEEVKKAIKAGKLQELINLTVQVVDEAEVDVDITENDAEKEGIELIVEEVNNQEGTVSEDNEQNQ